MTINKRKLLFRLAQVFGAIKTIHFPNDNVTYTCVGKFVYFLLDPPRTGA